MKEAVTEHQLVQDSLCAKHPEKGNSDTESTCVVAEGGGGGEEGRRVNFNRCGFGGGLKRPKIDSGRWLYNSERAKTTEL